MCAHRRVVDHSAPFPPMIPRFDCLFDMKSGGNFDLTDLSRFVISRTECSRCATLPVIGSQWDLESIISDDQH